MKSVSEKVPCAKIDKYYFKDHKGRIRKYLQFCRRKLCKTESSYNYENVNVGCDIKIAECELLRGSQFNFEKIPKLIYDSKVINVIKYKD